MDTGDRKNEDAGIKLSSTASRRVSLESIRYGKGNLDVRRQGLLDRVPESGMWVRLELNSLEMMDIAYLTAKTGHEFAILRGKHEDILYHGISNECNVLDDDVLEKGLLEKKLRVVGHSHPGEPFPEPSPDDRRFLWLIEQRSSLVISGITGICIEFKSLYFD